MGEGRGFVCIRKWTPSILICSLPTHLPLPPTILESYLPAHAPLPPTLMPHTPVPTHSSSFSSHTHLPLPPTHHLPPPASSTHSPSLSHAHLPLPPTIFKLQPPAPPSHSPSSSYTHLPLPLTHHPQAPADGSVNTAEEAIVLLVHLSRPDGTVDVDPLVHSTRQQTPCLLQVRGVVTTLCPTEPSTFHTPFNFAPPPQTLGCWNFAYQVIYNPYKPHLPPTCGHAHL